MNQDGSPGSVYASTEDFDRLVIAQELPGERWQLILSAEDASDGTPYCGTAGSGVWPELAGEPPAAGAPGP